MKNIRDAIALLAPEIKDKYLADTKDLLPVGYIFGDPKCDPDECAVWDGEQWLPWFSDEARVLFPSDMTKRRF